MDDEKKIHIVNTHGLGDVIMSLPVILYFIEQNNTVSLTLKGSLEASLLSAILPVDKFKKLEILKFSTYQAEGFSGMCRYLYDLRKINADVILTTHSIDNLKFNCLAFFSGAKKRVGAGGKFSFLNTNNIESYKAEHKVERNAELAAVLDSDITKVKLAVPKFHASENTVDLYKKFYLEVSSELIALAPGSGEVEKHKRWPVEKFASLANELVALGKHVIILGGPGEEWMGEYILESSYSDMIHDFTGKLDIEDTLKLLTLAEVLVANCNGLSHLGSLIDNLKVVGLYGPTNPRITAPYTDNLVIVSKMLECAPCYRRGYIQGCHEPKCMKEIEVELVLSEVLG